MTEEQLNRFEKLLEECKEGNHFWREWKDSFNSSLNPLTFKVGNTQSLKGYGDGEPQWRGCVICGATSCLQWREKSLPERYLK